MCIFRVVSKVHSFQEFIDLNPDFPVYKTHEKGEKMDIGKEDLLYEDYGIYVEVSDRSWRDGPWCVQHSQRLSGTSAG